MPPRVRRRSIGPPGAPASGVEPLALDLLVAEPHPEPPAGDEDERLRAERPPHHDRGV